jgi:MFS family permease
MDSTTGAVKSEPLLNKMLLLFMLAMILANLGGEMYGMLLPLYLKELNASVVQIGLFFTISQVVPLLVQILGGCLIHWDACGALPSAVWQATWCISDLYLLQPGSG